MHLPMTRNQYLCPECGRRAAGVCLGPHERLEPRTGSYEAPPDREHHPEARCRPGRLSAARRIGAQESDGRTRRAHQSTNGGERSKLLRAALAGRPVDRGVPKGVAGQLAHALALGLARASRRTFKNVERWAVDGAMYFRVL